MRDTRPPESQPAVLVVDPSKVTLVAARKLLEPHLSVYLAEDGAAAWELVESLPDIAAVFTDQHLPVLDGLGLLQRIRTAEDLRISDLPVIVITSGERNEAMRRAALDAGATDFILKPFDAVDLLTRVRAWCNTSQRAQLLRRDNNTLRELVMRDADTRAGNREYFLQETVKDRSFCIRHGGDHTLLYICVDNLERIQREQGRVAAGEAIVLVADAIRAKCRREDTFARVTESAFALSLLHTDVLGARVLAERIRQAIGLKPFKPRGMTVSLTVSIGIASPATDANLPAEQLLEAAEKSARLAARAGGNQTHVDASAGKSSNARATDAGQKQNASTTAPTTEISAASALINQAAAIADPVGFVAEAMPVLEKLADAERLALIDRLLVMTETPSDAA